MHVSVATYNINRYIFTETVESATIEAIVKFLVEIK